jgi:hypothetical protein
VGFCFGRALVAHTQAVLQKSTVPVLKLWSVGRLRRGSVRWQFHVTTLVLGCDQSWYSLDTLYRQPLTADAWVRAMRNDYNADPSNLFVITRADQFGPEGYDYGWSALQAHDYGTYFEDYLDQNPALSRIR